MIGATYTPDNRLFAVASAQLTFITVGWGNVRLKETLIGHIHVCGFKYYDQSFQNINEYLQTTSKLDEFTLDKYLFFLDSQVGIPNIIKYMPD